MENVKVLVRYDGEWEKSSVQSMYKGGSSKGIFVPKDVSHRELVEKMYEITKANRLTKEIEMRFIYKVHDPIEPVLIEGDDDVMFFIDCNMDKTIPGTALCISLKDIRPGNVREAANCAPEEEDPITFSSVNMEILDEIEDELNENPNEILDEIEDELNENPNVNTHEGLGNGNSNTSRTSQVSSNTSIEVAQELKVGEIFMDKKSLYKKVCMYAMKKHFQFKVLKSTKQLFVAGCVINRCKWWLRATVVKQSSLFTIRKFKDEHLSSDCFTGNKLGNR